MRRTILAESGLPRSRRRVSTLFLQLWFSFKVSSLTCQMQEPSDDDRRPGRSLQTLAKAKVCDYSRPCARLRRSVSPDVGDDLYSDSRHSRSACRVRGCYVRLFRRQFSLESLAPGPLRESLKNPASSGQPFLFLILPDFQALSWQQAPRCLRPKVHGFASRTRPKVTSSRW